MEVPGNLRLVCRLCWSYDLSLQWEEEMAEYNSLSYKDCFYKYTQFEESADRLSQYLCEECAENIKNFHLMVEKSVETLRFCERVANENGSMHDFSWKKSKEQLYFGGELLYEKSFTKGLGEISQQDYEQLSLSSEHVPDSTGKDDVFCKKSDNSNNSYEIDCDEFVESLTSCEGDDEPSVTGLNSVDDQKLAFTQETIASRPSISDIATKNPSQDYDEKSSSKLAKTPGMCSYCSKRVHGSYYLKLHEQTHEENRQREVACPKCGIKLYNKWSLNQHMHIHEENRVKKYKCEFCDKAFFNRGSCNIHRRIHLGPMLQCPLCPKQFYRQVELNRHISSHSHETLSSRNQAKPKKYYVHCKECDRKIASNRFNGHRASHMNDPFMRCTLCKKDFCSRKSGGKHMSCVHKRKGGDYDDITFYYQSKERPRLSLLLMKQQEDVEPVE